MVTEAEHFDALLHSIIGIYEMSMDINGCATCGNTKHFKPFITHSKNYADLHKTNLDTMFGIFHFVVQVYL